MKGGSGCLLGPRRIDGVTRKPVIQQEERLFLLTLLDCFVFSKGICSSGQEDAPIIKGCEHFRLQHRTSYYLYSLLATKSPFID